jgi:hypothetical protein
VNQVIRDEDRGKLYVVDADARVLDTSPANID